MTRPHVRPAGPAFGAALLLQMVVPSVLAAAPGQVGTEAPEAPAPIQVLILGIYHFSNPGLDVVQVEVPDVLLPRKQEEIGRVVDGLASFRPTKVAVEQVPATAARLDSLYAAYRDGRHDLSRNETQQLGFRLAARFGHDRVYPVDHPGEFPFQAVMEYAAQHAPAFVSLVEREIGRITEESNRRHRQLTIGEILRAMNDPGELAAGHAIYLEFARVGAGDTYVGADLLSKWYDRNIRIFANFQAAVEPGDRILLIVGAGHAPILRELVGSDARMVLVDPLGYLPES